MDLTQVIMSNASGPARVAIHGVEGSGKTTTACYFPKPIIIGAEQGIPRDLGFQVPTIRPGSWPELFDVIHSLMSDRHDFETAVIDTVDWIEPMLHAFVCERDSGRETEMNKKGKPLLSIEDYGFGKGYLAAEEEFCRFIALLDVLQHRRGMHVVMLMHTIVRTFKNPSGPDFDRFEPKCQQRVGSKVKEWAENLLFIHFRVDAGKISEDKERHKLDPSRARAKGIEGLTERLCGCQQSALYDAKNRVRLPPVVELHDPNVIVSHLLGLELGADVQAIADRTQRASITKAPTVGNDPNGFARTMAARPTVKAVTQPEPRPADHHDGDARTDERANAKWGRDERTMAMDRGETPPDLRVVPPPVPAHHESRKADEQRRQQDALAKAASARAQPHPNAPASADAAKTEARTWTEPRGSSTLAAAPTSRGPAPPNGAVQVDQKMLADLTSAITRASHLGPQYRSQVDAWCAKAAGDPTKLAAIIRRIDKNIEDARQQPSA